jgi:hypothetical protein
MPRIVVLLSSMAAMLMLVGGVAYAAFPGVNGKILYTDIESYDPGGEFDGPSHTYKINADGTGKEQLPDLPWGGSAGGDFSADGSKIVFSAPDQGINDSEST